MENLKKSAKYLLAVAAMILLYFSSQHNYLLFHVIAEVFSICIAITVFFITWNSLHLLKNNYLIIVGIAYLFIGFLDLFHTVAFPGMMIFTGYKYHANQLWIAARGLASSVLLISFVFLKSKKKVNTLILFAIYTVITTLTLLSVFTWDIFPIAYVEGVGQTPFKIISEFVIIAILIAALMVLIKKKEFFDGKVYRYLAVSILFTIASEACFSVYFGSYDFFNMLGHYLKIISFYYIYKSIIQTGIRQPYDLIFRELKQTEEQLHEQNSILSHQRVADGLTIKEHLAMLQQQYSVLNRQAKLLDLSHEAIFAWELNGPIFFWNKGAELMYGYTAEEAIGQASDELLKTQRVNNPEKAKFLFERDGTWIGEFVQVTKDGRQLTVQTAHQLYHEDDGRIAILELCRNVTEHNKIHDTTEFTIRQQTIEQIQDKE